MKLEKKHLVRLSCLALAATLVMLASEAVRGADGPLGRAAHPGTIGCCSGQSIQPDPFPGGRAASGKVRRCTLLSAAGAVRGRRLYRGAELAVERQAGEHRPAFQRSGGAALGRL